MDPLRIVQIAAPAELREMPIAPGFSAIVASADLPAMLSRVVAEGGVVTAALLEDRLIGYAADLPFLPVEWEGLRLARRWDALPDARELGSLEVAAPYRRRGVGARLMAALGADPRLDRVTLIAECLAWHWDLRAAQLAPFDYAALLSRLLLRAGFRCFATDSPEVAMDPASFLAARLGAATPAASRAAFAVALRS